MKTLDYGPAASAAFPPFWDQPPDQLWDDAAEECVQPRLKDFSGVDSVVSPLVALLVFATVQFLERNGPIIQFSKEGMMAPYLKENQSSGVSDIDITNKEENFEDDM